MSTRASTSVVSLRVLGFFLGCCLLVPPASGEKSSAGPEPTARPMTSSPGKFFTPVPTLIPAPLLKPAEPVVPAPVKKWYAGKEILSERELSFLLYEAGFRGKAHRLAWVVAMGESTGRPGSFNGSCCHGLFQINMAGSLKADRLNRYGLESVSELYDPAVNAKVAFRMSRQGTRWAAWSVNPYNRSAPDYPGVIRSLPKS